MQLSFQFPLFVAGHQFLHFGNLDHVVVAGDGVVFGVHHVAQGDVDVAALGHFPGDLPAECFVGCGVIPVGCACGLESRSLESEEHGIFAFAAESVNG